MRIDVDQSWVQRPTPHRRADTIADRLLAELVKAADPDGVVSMPTSALADALSTSDRQVRRSIGELRRGGLLALVRPAQHGNRYAPKVYRLVGGPGVLSQSRNGAVTRQVTRGM